MSIEGLLTDLPTPNLFETQISEEQKSRAVRKGRKGFFRPKIENIKFLHVNSM